jgi:hypothetical protein
MLRQRQVIFVLTKKLFAWLKAFSQAHKLPIGTP